MLYKFLQTKFILILKKLIENYHEKCYYLNVIFKNIPRNFLNKNKYIDKSDYKYR